MLPRPYQRQRADDGGQQQQGNRLEGQHEIAYQQIGQAGLLGRCPFLFGRESRPFQTGQVSRRSQSADGTGLYRFGLFREM